MNVYLQSVRVDMISVGLLNICIVILHCTLQLKRSKVSQCWLTSTYIHISANTLLLYWALYLTIFPPTYEVDSKFFSSPLCELRNVCMEFAEVKYSNFV